MIIESEVSPMKKKLLSFLLSAAMLLAVAPAALAADAGFSDMTSGVDRKSVV